MKKILILLSLVLTLSIITAYVGGTGVTPKAPTKQALVANQTPVPSTLTISAKFTDTTTTKAIKLDNTGTEYKFTNYVVLGNFDVTSDCTLHDEAKKRLTVQAGGCTLNVKAKPSAIVAGKNSGGAVLFGSTAIPLIASGAGAPKMRALKPYKSTSMSNKYTEFIDVPIYGVAINDKYTVTLPKKGDAYIINYLSRGESEQYCTETFEGDSTTFFINNPNFLFNPQWIMCSFAVRINDDVFPTIKSLTEILTVTHNDNNTTEYLYTYHTFPILYPQDNGTEYGSFYDTEVGKKSIKSPVVYLPAMSQIFPADMQNAPKDSYITFEAGFFDNFAINEEWSTCKDIKSDIYTKQMVDHSGCALVIDFIPSVAVDIQSSIKYEEGEGDNMPEPSNITFKGKGRTFAIVYPGDEGSTDSSVPFPDTKVGEKSIKSTIVYLPAMSQIYDNLSTAPKDAFLTFEAGFFDNFKINEELSTCTTVKSNYERQTVGETACQLVIYFMPKVAGESRSSIKFEHGPWTMKPGEQQPDAVIWNTDVKGTGI